MTTQFSFLQNHLKQFTLAQDGDGNEQQYCHLVLARFPNYEEFWRLFVVPATYRIEAFLGTKISNHIAIRQGIQIEIQEIIELHYSLFLNLAYLHLTLKNDVPRANEFERANILWLEDFFAHLVSACDLAEHLIENWYLLKLKITNSKSPFLDELSEEQFVEKYARPWYQENYAKVRKYYLARGKKMPPLIPTLRRHLLKEFLGEKWGPYVSFVQPIRTFRNRVVHDSKLGNLIGPANRILIPKPSKLSSYKSWSDVFAASNDPERMEDFVEPAEELSSQLEGLEDRLNVLWQFTNENILAEFGGENAGTLWKMYRLHELPYLISISAEGQGKPSDPNETHTSNAATTSTWAPKTNSG